MPVRSASSPQRIRPVAGQVRTASLARKRQSGSDLLVIKFRSVARMFSQKLARRELVLGFRERLQFLDNFLRSKMVCETQWAATEWRKTRPKNHSVIGIFRGSDHLFLNT